MIWIIVGACLVVIFVVGLVVYAVCASAGRADDQMREIFDKEKETDEPS